MTTPAPLTWARLPGLGSADPPPRASMRLQLHQGFGFAEVRAQLDYYAALGLSHLYLSPIFTARPGSTHGYDIVDFTRVNPELGGESGLIELAAAARPHGLGLIIDIVPNHMCADPTHNHWWRDVLRHGPRSLHAEAFDIDWHAPAHPGRLLLPILPAGLGECVARGDIRLHLDPVEGRFGIDIGHARLPLSPESEDHLTTEALAGSVDAVLAAHDPVTAAGAERLHALLDAQHYRLAWWRVAADEINWRRFFEISDLAGLRVEREQVFEASHALVFSLYRRGLIDGVRIDHVDGLADPPRYLRLLRRRLRLLHRHRAPGVGSIRPWVVVEKILADGEQLPHWPVDGTTGYDFLNDVLRLLHDPNGEAVLDACWRRHTGREADFAHEQQEARRQVLNENLVAEFKALARRLQTLAQGDPMSRDISLAMIERALIELLVHFPVYRIYQRRPGQRSEQDQRIMQAALEDARGSLRQADHPALDWIDVWLGALALEPARRRLQRAAIDKFQQLTSPLAAKSAEDTAYYRYNRLLSLNEVGGDPGLFCLATEAFHRRMQTTAREHPRTMLCTATHDHKRGEDLRARLAVLSELAPDWTEALGRWRAAVREPDTPTASTLPAPEDEIALWESLVGAWPPGLEADDAEAVRALFERLAVWQTKAVREAKRHTQWVDPDEAYEARCRSFLLGLLDPSLRATLEEVVAFAARLGGPGALNGLGQTLARLTAPGVPDTYQGTELWDLSLVDPDNRREVDYAQRRQTLQRRASWRDLLADWQDGSLKLRLIHAVLATRRRWPAVFGQGDYLPLRTAGRHADRVVAYLRRHRGRHALVAFSRLTAPLCEADLPRIASEAWEDTRILLPAELTRLHFVDQFTGRSFTPASRELAVSALFTELPLALLIDHGISGRAGLTPRHASPARRLGADQTGADAAMSGATGARPG